MTPLSLLAAVALAAPVSAPHRVAVVVGANDGGADRTTLRYAHDDARRVYDTLLDVGDFRPDEVALLLDPSPADLLGALDHALERTDHDSDTLLVFYYSGHADPDALFLDGTALPLAELRDRIDDERAAVRLGIIDACSGGGWTGTKGLVADPKPFEVPMALPLASAGSVLIASSSGIESAHETDITQGSLFTHHLVSGLRGAADASGDGQVTLNEAFDYAKSGTVRDAVLYARSAQHPSFHLDLRGKQELVLTRVDTAESWVELAQDAGPLAVIDLASGITVLELQPGERAVRLALVPGRYLVRRQGKQDDLYAHEFALASGQTLEIAEDELTLVGQPLLTQTKGPARHAGDPLTVQRGRTWSRIAMSVPLEMGGFETGATVGSPPLRVADGQNAFLSGMTAALPLSDRVDLLLPGVVRGQLVEDRLTLWGGVQSIGFLTSTDPALADRGLQNTVSLSAGLDGRIPMPRVPAGRTGTLLLGLDAQTLGHDLEQHNAGIDDLEIGVHLGWRLTWGRVQLTLPIGLGLQLKGDGNGQFDRPALVSHWGSTTLVNGLHDPYLSVLIDRSSGLALDLYYGHEVSSSGGAQWPILGLGLTWNAERRRRQRN